MEWNWNSIFAQIAKSEGKKLGEVSVIVMSDEELLKVNIEFLDHNYYTDVITFDNGLGNLINGELLISSDRVMDNSSINNVSYEFELKRIGIHGFLHLCGYKDKSVLDKQLMTQKENFYLERV